MQLSVRLVSTQFLLIRRDGGLLMFLFLEALLEKESRPN